MRAKFSALESISSDQCVMCNVNMWYLSCTPRFNCPIPDNQTEFADFMAVFAAFTGELVPEALEVGEEAEEVADVVEQLEEGGEVDPDTEADAEENAERIGEEQMERAEPGGGWFSRAFSRAGRWLRMEPGGDVQAQTFMDSRAARMAIMGGGGLATLGVGIWAGYQHQKDSYREHYGLAQVPPEGPRGGSRKHKRPSSEEHDIHYPDIDDRRHWLKKYHRKGVDWWDERARLIHLVYAGLHHERSTNVDASHHWVKSKHRNKGITPYGADASYGGAVGMRYPEYRQKRTLINYLKKARYGQ